MEKNRNLLDSSTAVNWLQAAVLTGLILYWCRSILVPISFSVLISFLLYPSCKRMEKAGIPRGIAIGIALVVLLLLIAGILFLLGNQFIRFADEWPELRSKIVDTYSSIQLFIEQRFGLTAQEQEEYLSASIAGEKGNLVSYVKGFLYGAAVNSVLLVLIPILSGLILYSRERWVKAIQLLAPEAGDERIVEMLRDTITAYFNFIKGMGIVYLTVGILNSIGLALLGIPHPILFGFIASVLTFIPFVGIIVASLLPIAVSWITYDSVWYPAGVIAIFTFVQYLEANVIFPMAVSNRLSINPFITIFVILLGGLIWGAAGMILFIPFVAILKLIADRSSRLRPLSALLGTGKAG
jgi:predicted PurR-regulated permease PerM